jgi:hypothetical protein
MRACFLGQNICALGFGVATLQAPPLLVDEQTGGPLRTDAPQKDGDKPPPGRGAPDRDGAGIALIHREISLSGT